MDYAVAVDDRVVGRGRPPERLTLGRRCVGSIIHMTRPHPPYHPLAAKLKVNNEMKQARPHR